MNTKDYDWPLLRVTRLPEYNGVTILRNGMNLARVKSTPQHGDLPYTYKVGDVFSYAASRAECPLKAFEKAKERGHNLAWLAQCSVSVTSRERGKEHAFFIEPGMMVKVIGRIYEVTDDRNDNLGLKFIRKADDKTGY